jgi:hypothetical protein
MTLSFKCICISNRVPIFNSHESLTATSAFPALQYSVLTHRAMYLEGPCV